jgi:lysophospholipase L1-like esterase
MKAMNGFARLLAKRARLIGCCTIAVLALPGLALTGTAAAEPPPPVKTYLALGDSLAFGYKAVVFAENFPTAEAPAYFEEGYTNFYATKLRANKETTNKGLVLVNEGCPGETAGGLTGNLATNRKGVKEVKCKYQTQLAMHNPYTGHSQLEGAVGVLKTKNKVTSETPAHPVVVASLNIGGNDELEGVKLCEEEVAADFGAHKIEASVTNGSAVMKEISTYEGVFFNSTIEGPGVPSGTKVAKLSEAEEAGKVLTMSNKATETIKAEYTVYGSSRYGKTPEGALNGCLLQHLEEIEEKIGKNIELAGGTLRNPAGGNYAGQLLILNGYNPNAELLKGSDVLVALINKRIEKATTAVGGTYVNVFKTFNPQPPEGKEATPATEAKEQASICKLTEMCNPAAVAIHEAEVGKPLPPTDGDIHPSKAGAEAIATLMYAAFKG